MKAVHINDIKKYMLVIYLKGISSWTVKAHEENYSFYVGISGI
jgi:hypothetical protein